MTPATYEADELQRQYDDAMARRDILIPNRITIGTLISRAKANGYVLPRDRHVEPISKDLSGRAPIYRSSGMPPRKFAGPEIAKGACLFPMEAITLFAALGGVGKTTALMKFGCHIAAGRDYGGAPVIQRRVLYYCVEEAEVELDRKFGAAIQAWPDIDRISASANLRIQSCVGIDARLTQTNERQVGGTGIAETIIRAVNNFEAEVVMIDHLQGFVSGDLNASDTATALSIELNKIVAATGAAVVVAAHVNKGQINAQEIGQGFATGSLAFENAARQLVGMIRLPDEEAKKYGLEAVSSEYGLIGIPKNSYGRSNVQGYFSRVYVSSFHTVTIEPFVPSFAATTHIPTASERLADAIADFATKKGLTTRAELERVSGTKGIFKASKSKVRQAVSELVGDGRLLEQECTQAERIFHGLPRQTRKVLRAPP